MHAPSREADALTVGEAPSGLETEALGEDAAAPSSSLTPPVKNEGRNEGFREWPFLGVSDPVTLLVLISIGDGLPSARQSAVTRLRQQGAVDRRMPSAEARRSAGRRWVNFQSALPTRSPCAWLSDVPCVCST